MPNIEFNCLPTVIGSMPNTDPQEACEHVTRYLKDIPAWPQLPRRSFLEDMCVQFSQGFPGIAVKEDKIYVDRSQNLEKPLEELYTAYLENNAGKYLVTRDYAAGLHTFLAMENLLPFAVKGQVTGPITWGFTVTDSERKAIIYDDTLADAAAKLLRLKAAWQEKELSKISRNTIIFVDEPSLSYFKEEGKSSKIKKKDLAGFVRKVTSAIREEGCYAGIHCCGAADWSLLLGLPADILSFDAYSYAASLALYPAQVKEYLARGGTIAWGIVPNNDEIFKVTAEGLANRLRAGLKMISEKAAARGVVIKPDEFNERSLIVPACGLGSTTVKIAEEVLEKLAETGAILKSDRSLFSPPSPPPPDRPARHLRVPPADGRCIRKWSIRNCWEWFPAAADPILRQNPAIQRGRHLVRDSE